MPATDQPKVTTASLARGALATVAAWIARLAAVPGVLVVERWLFFAGARQCVGVFCGR